MQVGRDFGRKKLEIAPFAYSLYFIAFAHVIEIITFTSLGIGFLPTHFFLNFSLVFALAAVIYFVKNRYVQAVMVAAFITLQIVIFFVNHSLFGAYGEILNVETLFIAAAGMEAVEMSFLSTTALVLSIALALLNFALIVLIERKVINPYIKRMRAQKKREEELSIRNTYQPPKKSRSTVFAVKSLVAVLVFATTLSVFGVTATTLPKGTGTPVYASGANVAEIEETGSLGPQSEPIRIPNLQGNDRLLFERQFFRVPALQKFGSYAFYFKTLWNHFFVKDSKAQVNRALAYMEQGQRAPQSEVDLSDHNFIVILMESIDTFAIHRVYINDDPLQGPDIARSLTPNLLKLTYGIPFDVADEGIVAVGAGTSGTTIGNFALTNFHSKGRTNVSETASILGTAPYFSNYSYTWLPATPSRFAGAMDFSLPQRFKARDDLEFTTTYMINHSIEYYGRTNVFNPTVFGFDETVCGLTIGRQNGLMRTWGEWAPDSWLFEQAQDKLVPDLRTSDFDRFYTHITTMIPHGPYMGAAHGFAGTRPAPGKTAPSLAENLAKVRAAEAAGYWTNLMVASRSSQRGDRERFRHYIAQTMDFDNMLGLLYARLHEIGEIDRTTIMMFTDHEAYYYNIAQKALNMSTRSFRNPEIYRVPAFIMSPAFAPGEDFAPGETGMPATHEIAKFTSIFDVYATIMDMAGMSFNRNLSMGESAFVTQTELRVLLSPTGGILNQYIFSMDGSVRNRDVFRNFELTTAARMEFYRAANYVVFQADMQRKLFDHRLYLRLNNKHGLE